MGQSFDVILLLAYTVGSVAGLIMMKAWLTPAVTLWRAGSYFTMPTLLVGMGVSFYVLSFLLWLIILTRNELSLAYPVAIGLTLVALTVASKIMLGESLNPTRLLGIIVIFAGIWLVTRA